MAELFQVKEVVEIGMMIEENGELFYNHLKNSSEDEKTREIFEYLENEEKNHKVIFERMGDLVKDIEPAESYAGEQVAYMRALADKHVFTKKNAGLEVAQKVTSPMAAIEMALKFEDESVELFKSMRNFVPQSEYGTIDKLVAEEQNHVVKLKELQNSLGR